MKLRSQLALLVGGIVVVPFLVATSVLLLQYLNARTNARDPERMLPGAWIRSGTARSVRIGELRGLAEQRPQGMEVVVLGADDTIEFSTMPGFVAGGSVDAEAVLKYLRENDQATLIRPREPKEGTGSRLSGMPSCPTGSSSGRRRRLNFSGIQSQSDRAKRARRSTCVGVRTNASLPFLGCQRSRCVSIHLHTSLSCVSSGWAG